MTRVTLLVEGDGDVVAVPLLVRDLLADIGLSGIRIQPRVKKVGAVPKLRRAGELERLVQYADMEAGEAILLLLDLDDGCPFTVAREFRGRIAAIQPPIHKRVGMGFFRREFESLFLYSLPAIAERFPAFGWKLEDYDPERDFETIRGAKEALRKWMKPGKTYKETSDQVRFAGALDKPRLRKCSRSFRHFENTLRWLGGAHAPGVQIYPEIS